MGFTKLTEIKIKDIFPLDNVVHPSGLRRKNAPYLFIWVFYYTWVFVFANWWTDSPALDFPLDLQVKSLMHAVILISSAAFVFVMGKERFVRAAGIGAAGIVLSMILFFVLPSAELKLFAAVVGSIAIGCVNICILIPFVFRLNNTEKLYSVVTGNVLIQIVLLIVEHSPIRTAELFLSPILLILALCPVLFFKKEPSEAETMEEIAYRQEMNPRVYLALLFNCGIVILCMGAGKGILSIAAGSAGSAVFTAYSIGGLIGCLIYLLAYGFTKKAYIWLGNITFSSIALGLLCNAFSPQVSFFTIPFAVLIGLGTTIGMINMYYIIGVIGKKYDNIRYVRLSILVIGVCGGVSSIIISNTISRIGSFQISIFASILSAVIVLAFMFVAPIMERAEYVNDWGRDSGNIEVGGNRFAMFKPYGLSKREAEVCDLLLQGYTLRQTSAILSIGYSTVNTYCTSAYRKLKINSRTELLLKFKDSMSE